MAALGLSMLTGCSEPEPSVIPVVARADSVSTQVWTMNPLETTTSKVGAVMMHVPPGFEVITPQGPTDIVQLQSNTGDTTAGKVSVRSYRAEGTAKEQARAIAQAALTKYEVSGMAGMSVEWPSADDAYAMTYEQTAPTADGQQGVIKVEMLVLVKSNTTYLVSAGAGPRMFDRDGFHRALQSVQLPK